MRTMPCFAMGINRQNYTTIANMTIQQFRILNNLFPEVEIFFVVEEYIAEVCFAYLHVHTVLCHYAFNTVIETNSSLTSSYFIVLKSFRPVKSHFLYCK